MASDLTGLLGIVVIAGLAYVVLSNPNILQGGGLGGADAVIDGGTGDTDADVTGGTSDGFDCGQACRDAKSGSGCNKYGKHCKGCCTYCNGCGSASKNKSGKTDSGGGSGTITGGGGGKQSYCPSNSHQSGTNCLCNSGYKASGGQCVKVTTTGGGGSIRCCQGNTCTTVSNMDDCCHWRGQHGGCPSGSSGIKSGSGCSCSKPTGSCSGKSGNCTWDCKSGFCWTGTACNKPFKKCSTYPKGTSSSQGCSAIRDAFLRAAPSSANCQCNPFDKCPCTSGGCSSLCKSKINTKCPGGVIKYTSGNCNVYCLKYQSVRARAYHARPNLRTSYRFSLG